MANQEINKKILFQFNPFVKEPFIRQVVDGDERIVLASRDNIVCEGDVLARVLEEGDEMFRSQSNPRIEEMATDYTKNPAENVDYRAESKAFVSRGYGFAKIIEGRCIEVVPLLDISEDSMVAEIPIYKNMDDKLPSLNEIKKIINKAKIMFPLDDSEIQTQLDAIKNDTKPIGTKIKVAEGTEPVKGHPELIELRKSIEKTVGKELEDGRIDYYERQSYCYVKKGELIAERIPAKEPEEGVDIFGGKTKAELEGKSHFKLGDGLEQHEYNENLFVAAHDGVLDLQEGKDITFINVRDRLIVNENISLNTGNIHFDGDVEINGNVNSGFKVDATGDIVINGNVEDATVISERGTIFIKNGVSGKENCNITSKDGNIEATFVQNANLWAKKEIIINESIINSKAFARERISVKAHCVGSDVTARQAIECGVAGSRAEAKTSITVGKDPEIDAMMDEIDEQLNVLPQKLKDTMNEITMMFGDDIFAKAKKILPTLPKQKQIKCLTLLKDIKEKNEEIKQLKIRREELKSMLQFEKPPYVKIETEAHGGVIIRIKNLKPYRIIKKHLGGVFKEDPVKKEIKYE
jgi:uncharacterized protein